MLVLGIGEVGVAAERGARLRTSVLGPRVAVACHCPRTGVAGLLQIAHPRSASDPGQASVLPGYYADTGIPELLRRMRGLAPGGDLSGLAILLVGSLAVDKAGAGMGPANLAAATRALSEAGLSAWFEDLGDGSVRAVTLEAGHGRIGFGPGATAL